MRSIRQPLAIAVLAFLLTAAPSALASDGVREINQTCAVEAGCFAGDGPGFPVSIRSLGSYRLTSDLIVPSENVTAIEVGASDVGIDLNNFAIVRAGCVGATAVCTSSTGTGTGITSLSAAVRGTSVKNGSIVGMGSYGVFLGEQAEVKNLRVRWNRLEGIVVTNASTVSGSIALENGGFGIRASTGSVITANSAYRNGLDGLFAGANATVMGNTSYSNGGDGIETGNGATISGNATHDNGRDGIDSGRGCTIVDNTSFDNGDATNPDLDDGIECGIGCLVRGNTVEGNSGYGLRLGTNSGYRENLLNANTAGAVAGSGVDAGANIINGVVTSTP